MHTKHTLCDVTPLLIDNVIDKVPLLFKKENNKYTSLNFKISHG